MANSTSQRHYLCLYQTLGDVSGGLYCLHRHRSPTSVTGNPISVRHVRGRVDCPRVNNIQDPESTSNSKGGLAKYFPLCFFDS